MTTYTISRSSSSNKSVHSSFPAVYYIMHAPSGQQTGADDEQQQQQRRGFAIAVLVHSLHILFTGRHQRPTSLRSAFVYWKVRTLTKKKKASSHQTVDRIVGETLLGLHRPVALGRSSTIGQRKLIATRLILNVLVNSELLVKINAMVRLLRLSSE